MRDGLLREIAPFVIEAASEVFKDALCSYLQVRPPRLRIASGREAVSNHLHLAYCHLSRARDGEGSSEHLERAREEVRAALSVGERTSPDRYDGSMVREIRRVEQRLSGRVVTGQDVDDLRDRVWELSGKGASG